MPEKRLFLLDSYALAFRMFYAYYKSPLINSAGLNVSMVHGYWGAVLRILDTHKPTHFAIVRDVSAPTFRHELFPEYKANRGPMPEEMVAQMPLEKHLLQVELPYFLNPVLKQMMSWQVSLWPQKKQALIKFLL